MPLDNLGGGIEPRCYPEPVVVAADFQRWPRDGPGSHVALPWLLKIFIIILTTFSAKEEDFFFTALAAKNEQLLLQEQSRCLGNLLEKEVL